MPLIAEELVSIMDEYDGTVNLWYDTSEYLYDVEVNLFGYKSFFYKKCSNSKTLIKALRDFIAREDESSGKKNTSDNDCVEP